MQTVRRAQACGTQEPLRLCIWADWPAGPQDLGAVMAAGVATWPGSNHWRESSASGISRPPTSSGFLTF